MHIESETSTMVEKVIAQEERLSDKRERQLREDARLSKEINLMRRVGRSVERSKETGKIGKFNEKFVKSVSRLSVLRQTTPRVTAKMKEDAERALETI